MTLKRIAALAVIVLAVIWYGRIAGAESSARPGYGNEPRRERMQVTAGPDARAADRQRSVEADLLRASGAGGNFSAETISFAIEKAGAKKKTLLLKPGNWKVDADLLVPANITLQFQEGAVLSIRSGSRVVVDGSLKAGAGRIFSGNGKVRFRKSSQDVYPSWWKDDDDRLYNRAIERALASGARSLYFPEGTYRVAITAERPLKIPSNVRVHGAGLKSVLKVVEAPETRGEWAGNDLFAGKGIENVEISRLTFDAEEFYPDPETTSRLDPSIRGTRAVRLLQVNNCKIAECRFQGFTNGSVCVTGNNIVIDRNSFYHGSYRTQTVRLDGSKIVTVSNNTFDDNGPHHYMVLGRPLETSSTDALLVGYNVENAWIVNNSIANSSGCGIRVEMSRNVQVIGNTISEVGQDGITFYLKDRDCSCVGNVISNWGRLNNFAYLRRENGKIYNPREYHYAAPSALQLPKRLDRAATWERNRYYLQGRDQSTIPEYDPGDYQSSTRAFRGFSGISVTDGSQKIAIVGNRITGNTSTTDGLFNYASNYGINVGVHNVNPPTASGDCVIANNTISQCIDYDLYCPQYVDKTSKAGVALPSSIYGNTYSPGKIDFHYRQGANLSAR